MGMEQSWESSSSFWHLMCMSRQIRSYLLPPFFFLQEVTRGSLKACDLVSLQAMRRPGNWLVTTCWQAVLSVYIKVFSYGSGYKGEKG